MTVFFHKWNPLVGQVARGATIVCVVYGSSIAKADCRAQGPRLTIDRLDDPAFPLIDSWQVLLEGVPLSDAQVAALARDEVRLDALREGVSRRGIWVYLGMGATALGTAASSAGWILFGKNDQPQTITLPLAIGGLLMGIVGVLVVSQGVQVPLEPFVAPTPQHRLSRQELRQLLVTINQRWMRSECSKASFKKRPSEEAEAASRIQGAKGG